VLQAFEHARQADFPQLVVMNEEKELIILDADESATTYEANNFGADWHELFDGASITPTMAVKILSFSQHYNKPTFTSQDVATWMKSTERNGRRIVTELERLGLIAIVNEQQSGSRGRPRKVYAFKNIQQ
jgi:response regulator of citrate/malate metabolism